MNSLILAEKPSVAKSISDVLGAKSRKDGYYEGGGYAVSWCVGHLLGLAEPQAYDAMYPIFWIRCVIQTKINSKLCWQKANKTEQI